MLLTSFHANRIKVFISSDAPVCIASGCYSWQASSCCMLIHMMTPSREVLLFRSAKKSFISAEYKHG